MSNNRYALMDNSSLYDAVDHIKVVGRPGIIKPSELTQLEEHIDAKSVMNYLPPGITRDDFIGILKLSLLTECATKTYSDGIKQSANDFKQDWLREFIDEVWDPDETNHHAPYKIILMDLGFSEEELDREIKDAREATYTHVDGYNPAKITTFGMIQEYLTENWHGLGRKVFHASGKSPITAHNIGRIEGRESLHKVWYRDFTKLQIIQNPTLISHVADTIIPFQMPGTELVPDLQEKAGDWRKLLETDPERLKRKLILLTIDALDGMENTGSMIVDIAAKKEIPLVGPVNGKHLRIANDVFGGAVDGLMAESLMEAVGARQAFIDQDKERGLAGKIRGAQRTYIAGKVDEFLASVA